MSPDGHWKSQVKGAEGDQVNYSLLGLLAGIEKKGNYVDWKNHGTCSGEMHDHH